MGTINSDNSVTMPDGTVLKVGDPGWTAAYSAAWKAQQQSTGSTGKQEAQVFMGTTPGRMPKGSDLFGTEPQTGPPVMQPSPVQSGTKRVFGPDGTSIEIPVNTAPPPDQGTPPTNKILGLDAAINAPLLWKQKTQLKAIERAKALGYSVTTFADFLKVWEAAVKQSAAAYDNGTGKKISPWDMLGMLAAGSSTDKNGGTGTTPPFTGVKTTTSTNTSIDDIDPATADSVLTSTLTQLLGRAPTDAEKSDYLSRANGLSKLNPAITQTTTKTNYQNGEATGQQSFTHQTGGVTQADLQSAAENQAKANPEYGAYQAAGTVYNWLTSALGAAA